MASPQISVITASCRPDGLAMAWRCLANQTHREWEWLVGMPEDKLGQFDASKITQNTVRTFSDPPRDDGDLYCLNKSWNQLVSHAHGELLVFLCDWIWFDQFALERFWHTYLAEPKVCVSSFGHHYRSIDALGKPQVLWQEDLRAECLERDAFGRGRPWDGHTMPAHLMEFAFCSIPRSQYNEVGGLDPAYDQVAGMSEKELALRLAKAGCQFWLAPAVEIRNWTHKREHTTDEWDAAYKKAMAMFEWHRVEIETGVRRRI